MISAASKAGTMPSLSVVQTLPSRRSERRSRALFAAEAKRTVEQAIDEPLEADRHLVELPAKLRGDAIDHLAAHHRLADRRFLAPLRPVLKEVEDGDGKVVVGRQQPCALGDDPVPVVVGVAGEGDVEAVLHPDQSLHRIGRGWVHADLAVPIHGHETEGRIDRLVDNREVQPVALGDRPPVVDPGAAERIDPQADLRAANGVHVDHVAEIGDVGVEIVVPVRRGGAKSLLERNSFHALQAVLRETRSPSPRSRR